MSRSRTILQVTNVLFWPGKSKGYPFLLMTLIFTPRLWRQSVGFIKLA